MAGKFTKRAMRKWPRFELHGKYLDDERGRETEKTGRPHPIEKKNKTQWTGRRTKGTYPRGGPKRKNYNFPLFYKRIFKSISQKMISKHVIAQLLKTMIL